MAKKKKSRKVGIIGVRKDPDYKHTSSSGRLKKKRKGKAPGSRHNVEEKRQEKSTSLANKDPRHGSKKPVQLVKAATTAKIEKRKYATPAEELAAIEADSRLMSLLDRLDDNDTLSKEQQDYVDTKMARHKILCELLGIVDDEDDAEEKDEFDALDAIKIDDYER